MKATVFLQSKKQEEQPIDTCQQGKKQEEGEQVLHADRRHAARISWRRIQRNLERPPHRPRLLSLYPAAPTKHIASPADVLICLPALYRGCPGVYRASLTYVFILIPLRIHTLPSQVKRTGQVFRLEKSCILLFEVLPELGSV